MIVLASDRPPPAGIGPDPAGRLGAAFHRAARSSGRSGGDVAAADRDHRRNRSQAPGDGARSAAAAAISDLAVARPARRFRLVDPLSAQRRQSRRRHAAGDHRACGALDRHCRRARRRRRPAAVPPARHPRGACSSISARSCCCRFRNFSGACSLSSCSASLLQWLPFTGQSRSQICRLPHGIRISAARRAARRPARHFLERAPAHDPAGFALGIAFSPPSCACCARACSTSIRKTTSSMARLRGLSERRILLRHALKNAFLPTLSLMGVQFGFLFGGTLLVEVIYLLSRSRQSDGRRRAQCRSADHPD